MSLDQLTATDRLDITPEGHRTGMTSLALGAGAVLVLGSLPILPYLVLLALPLGVAAVVSGVRALREVWSGRPGVLRPSRGSRWARWGCWAGRA